MSKLLTREAIEDNALLNNARLSSDEEAILREAIQALEAYGVSGE